MSISTDGHAASSPSRQGTSGRSAGIRLDATTLLIVYVCLLVLLPARLVISFLPIAVTPAMILGAVALAWWFNARLVAGLGVATGWQPVRYFGLLFLAAILLSYAYAYFRPIGADASSGADRNLVVMAAMVGITVLAADGIRDRGRLDLLIRMFVGMTVAIAMLGVLQFFTGVDIVSWVQLPGLRPVFDFNLIGERSDFRRPAGTATHSIEYGVVLATALPLAMHYAFYAQGRRSIVLRWAGVVIIGAALLMSLSRSAILGAMGVGLMLFFTWSRRRRVRALLILPVFLAAMRLLVSGLIGTLLGLFANVSSDPSYTGRTEDYPAAFRAFSESKLIGQGFGTFPMLLDNQYLGLLIETGIVGFTVVLGGFLVTIFTARGARLRSSEPFDRDLAQALAASVVVPLIAFATFDALAFPMFTGVTFLCVGLCGAAWRFAWGEDRGHQEVNMSSAAAR